MRATISVFVVVECSLRITFFTLLDAAIVQEACPNRTIRDPWPQSTKSFLAKDRNKVRNQHIDDMGVVTHTTAGWSYFEVRITHSKLY